MDLAKSVKAELSGSSAKSYVAQITRFHRIQGSPMFSEAAEYVKSEVEKLGLHQPKIEEFPADGKTKYWTYTSPLGWDVEEAELWQVKPEERLLCKYTDVPQSLHTYSNATPPKGIVADLVNVGSGVKLDDYKGKKVKGKLVLASGRARRVHELAVLKYSAVGVLTDSPIEMPNVREALDIPDAHAYQGIWPKAVDLPKIGFGFSLSKRQGNSLRSALREGKPVRLKAKVKTRLFSFHEDVVTATIRGKSKPQEEILLIAHLCHPKPSANDNASGSGLLLEVARTVKKLVDSGKIPKPARTIRFLWVPETLGSVAYIGKHPEISKNTVAAINLDMVGQNQDLCRSTLSLDRTPDSLPSYLNDFVFSLIEQSVNEFDHPTHFGPGSTFRYRTQAFSGGSDHAEFSESTTHVPCVMLLQWPDMFYHTSMDTIDKVSEDSLKRVGWITTVAALSLANVSKETGLLLANLSLSGGLSRLSDLTSEAVKKMVKAVRDKPRKLNRELARIHGYYLDKIEHGIWREQEAVKSVKRFVTDEGLDTLLEIYRSDIRKTGKRETEKLNDALIYLTRTSAKKPSIPLPLGETKVEKQLKTIVPKRLFKGTLSTDSLKDELGLAEYEWYYGVDEKDSDFSKKMLEIVNLIDGHRNGSEILKAVSSEYSFTNPAHVLRFLSDLRKTGFVEYG